MTRATQASLPMGAIRSLAGYNGADGMHFNTRTVVQPCQELCEMTALGRFALPMLSKLAEEEDACKHPTALGVLSWFCDLASAFIQDMAAMLCLHPEREDSTIVQQLPFLQSAEFQVSKCY